MHRYILTVLSAAVFLTPLMFSVSKASAGEIYHREVRQQQRINQGVKNGTIQPGEYRNLERRETALNSTRQNDLKENDGHLTAQERRNLNQRENNLSNSIYRDKHN